MVTSTRNGRYGLSLSRNGISVFSYPIAYNASMLGDLVKALELLVNILKGKGSPDHKREALAKELLALHQNIDSVVNRGRTILDFVAERNPYPDDRPVQLLSEQIGALDAVSTALTTGVIGSVLQLHMPDTKQHLHAYFDFKKHRVCIRLDQLISEGKELQPEKWIESMEQKMEHVDVPSTGPAWPHALTFYTVRFGPDDHVEPANPKALEPNTRFVIDADTMEIALGHELLNRIAAENSQLRTFLIDKFHFEDVL
jgi:hypothetical protein